MPENPSSSPPGGMLQAEVLRDRERTTLVLVGELDLSVIDTAREKLREARQAEPSQVVVDLSRLTFIDSTGIAFLVAAVKDDGDHRLSFIPCEAYAVQRVLSVTGVSEMLDGAPREMDGAGIERERETLSEG